MNADEVFIPDISEGYYRRRWLSRDECSKLAAEVSAVMTIIAGQRVDDEQAMLSCERTAGQPDAARPARIDRMRRIETRLSRVKAWLLKGSGRSPE